MTEIFKSAALELDRLINNAMYPGKTPMVCSQFVFQCYSDAPPAYHLIIENGAFQSGVNLLSSSPVASETQKRFIDYVLEQPTTPQMLAAVSNTAVDSAPIDNNKLAQELLAALQDESEDLSFQTKEFQIDDELVRATRKLGDSLAYPAKFSNSPEDGLISINKNASLFVTPADLKRHCVNVTTAGTAQLSRE